MEPTNQAAVSEKAKADAKAADAKAKVEADAKAKAQVIDGIGDAAIIDRCERVLQHATATDMQHAEELFTSYGLATGGRSAITGEKMPAFAKLPATAQAGWVAVALRSRFGTDPVSAKDRILNPPPRKTVKP